MSRSSLSFCSSAAFLGMTSACGSFLGLGGRTEEAAELAITTPRRSLRAATARAYDDRPRASGASAVRQQGGAGAESRAGSRLLNIHELEAARVIVIKAA